MELLCPDFNYFQLRRIKPEAPGVQKWRTKPLNSLELNREITANKTSWMIAASEYGMSCNHQTAEEEKRMFYWLTVHSAIFRALVIAVCTCAPVALRHAEYLNVF